MKLESKAQGTKSIQKPQKRTQSMGLHHFVASGGKMKDYKGSIKVK